MRGRTSTFNLLLFGLLLGVCILLIALPPAVLPIVTVAVLAGAVFVAVTVVSTILNVMADTANRAAERRGEVGTMQRPVRVGRVEAALVLFAGLLIAGEIFAVINGYGAFFAVVTLGYFMAAGAGYLVYRKIQTERTASAAAPAPDTTVPDEQAERRRSMATPIPLTESHAAARRSDLLGNLSDEQAEAVLALARWDSVPAGSRLAEAGAEGDSIYIIVDGSVELSGRSNVGEVTVRVAGPGESFPLAALLGRGTLVTSATAMTDIKAYVVPRRQLAALCESRPDIGMAIYATVAEVLADRYRSMLARHMAGVNTMVRQADLWANV